MTHTMVRSEGVLSWVFIWNNARQVRWAAAACVARRRGSSDDGWLRTPEDMIVIKNQTPFTTLHNLKFIDRGDSVSLYQFYGAIIVVFLRVRC